MVGFLADRKITFALETDELGKWLPQVTSTSLVEEYTETAPCNSLEDRTRLINHLKKKDILSVFHYFSLHKSQYYVDKLDGRELINADRYSDCLVRMPMYYELTEMNVEKIIDSLWEFFGI